jgi:hypothetical protein
MMDADERTPVTIQELTALKTASHDCFMVSQCSFQVPTGVWTTVLGDGPQAAAKQLRGYLLDTVLGVWESWDTLLTYQAVETLQRFNAGRHDPVSVAGGLYATYHEAAGYLLYHLLTLPIKVDTDQVDLVWKPSLSSAETRRFFLNWLCDQASDSVSICRQIIEAVKNGRPQVDWDVFGVEVVNEWATAVRGVETETSYRTKQTEAKLPTLTTDNVEAGNGSTSKTQRRATTNARMFDVLTRTPDCRGWTVSRWSAELKCSRGAIHATPIWKELKAARDLIAAEHATTNRRRSAGRRKT